MKSVWQIAGAYTSSNVEGLHWDCGREAFAILFVLSKGTSLLFEKTELFSRDHWSKRLAQVTVGRITRLYLSCYPNSF